MLLKVLARSVHPHFKKGISNLVIKSFATSASDNEYEIDLISLKKTYKKHPSFFNIEPNVPKVDSSVILTSINQIKQDPLDYKGYKKLGYLEFAENYTIEITEFTRFAGRPISEINTESLLTLFSAFSAAINEGKLPSVNKYNSQSYKNMISRATKYVKHDPNFSVTLEQDLLPFVQNKATMLKLYCDGIVNYLNELKSLHSEFDFNRTSIGSISLKLNEIINQFNLFLKDMKTQGNFNDNFFEIFIQIHRYQNLWKIVNNVPELTTSHLLLVINDCDSQKISNRIKLNSGNDLAVQNLVKELTPELGLITSFISFKTFPEFFQKLYKYTESDDEVLQRSALAVMLKFLPLLCNAVLLNEDVEIIPQFPVMAQIATDPRENYEFNLLCQVGKLYNHVGVLKFMRSKLHEINPVKHNFADFSRSDITSVLNHTLTYFRGSHLAREELKGVLQGLEFYFDNIKWHHAALDQFTDNGAMTSVLREYMNETYPYIDVNDSYVASELIEEIDQFGSSSYARSMDPELSKYKFELNLFKSSELDGLSYECFEMSLVMKILDQRITEVADDSPSTTPLSALNKGNIDKFMELKNYLLNNPDQYEFLELVILKPQRYKQLPDDLELEKFVDQLSIVKNDILGHSFKNISAAKINLLLDLKIHEAFKTGNRKLPINAGNVYNFIRLSKRLTRLFEANDENTEILDILIQSQLVLNDVEKKIAAKKQAKTAAAAAAPEPVPEPVPEPTKAYVQVPDDLELHKFTKELEILKTDELRAKFCNFDADKINRILDKRINEVHNDLPNSNPMSRLTKENLFEFMRMSKRLTRLFDINGGNTAILDTLIQSQSVFDDIESKIKSKKAKVPAPKKEFTPYRHLPDDFLIQEYIMELMELKSELGGEKFKNYDAAAILEKLKAMSTNEKKFNLDKRIVFSKLYRNLSVLFRHNGKQSHVLDNVLINSQAFSDFESKINTKLPKEEKTTANKRAQAVNGKYNDTEHILSLLTKNGLNSGFNEEGLLESEVDLKNAVSDAFHSKQEKDLYEEDPEEFKDLVELTAEKIRNKYADKRETPEVKVDKESLQHFLENAKKEKANAEERKFRQDKAYEWSKSMYNSHRSLEAHNFFNPLPSMTRSGGLLFPEHAGRHGKVQYLLLTIDGQMIKSEDNPLGTKQSHEDMFTILNKFSKEDLHLFIRNVKKLQKKGWKLIGGGGKEKMLVFKRVKLAKKRVFLTKVKTILATAGAVFLSLVGINFWLEDKPVVKESEQLSLPPVPLPEEVKEENEVKPNKGIFWK